MKNNLMEKIAITVGIVFLIAITAIIFFFKKEDNNNQEEMVLDETVNVEKEENENREEVSVENKNTQGDFVDNDSKENEVNVNKSSQELLEELLLRDYSSAVKNGLYNSNSEMISDFKIYKEVKSPYSNKIAVLYGTGGIEIENRECNPKAGGIFINNNGVLGGSAYAGGSCQGSLGYNIKWIDDENITYEYVILSEGGVNKTEKSMSIFSEDELKKDIEFIDYENSELGIRLKYPKKFDKGLVSLSNEDKDSFEINIDNLEKNWKFNVYNDVKNDNLEEFVRSLFGEDVEIYKDGDFKIADSEFIFIAGINMSDEKMINYSDHYKYGVFSKKYNKLLIFGVKEDCFFQFNEVCVDEDVINSLEFFNGE